MSSNIIAVELLEIVRKSTLVWALYRNSETEPFIEDAYRGGVRGESITIKSANGAPVFLQVPYSLIKYYDTMDAGNNLTDPQNVLEMFTHLSNQGFFLASSGGGGGGGSDITNFLELEDVQIPTYIGRNGQFIVINGNGLSSAEIEGGSFISLSDWLGGDLLPNQYILSDSTGGGLVQASINNIVNRAHAYDEYQILDKGYTWDGDTIIPNTNLYSLEIGDVIRKWFYVLPSEDFPSGQVLLMENGRYKGGDINVPLNYIHSGLKSYAFDTDPDKEI